MISFIEDLAKKADKVHNKSLDFLLASWKEEDDIEKQILKLHYLKYSKKAVKLNLELVEVVKTYLHEK